MRIAFIARDLSDNSLGRLYCLWLLAHELRWETIVVSSKGAEVWGPLQGTAFADNCARSDDANLGAIVTAFHPDVIIAGKPFPASLGRAVEIGTALDVPVILDNDDPDLEVGLSWHDPARRLIRELANRKRVQRYRRMRALTRAVPSIVSNPTLQHRWGGVVIPHIRPDTGASAARASSDETNVVFVGTNRPHKGVPELRKAIRDLHPEGFTLTLTAPRPDDAEPWERWVGHTSLAEGTELVRGADIVAIPSRSGVTSQGQLPAKLVDAMVAGRAIVASNLPPIVWATDGAAILSRPGSAASLRDAIAQLGDPTRRENLGTAARKIAVARFTPEANVGKFSTICQDAVRSNAQRG